MFFTGLIFRKGEFQANNFVANLLLGEETYRIIGLCMDIHNILGFGFREIVYKDAMEYEFKKIGLPYVREKPYLIPYKDIILPRTYDADFLAYDSVLLEVKARSFIHEDFLTQTRNYLKASGLQLGLILNFGEPSFKFKRVIL